MSLIGELLVRLTGDTTGLQAATAKADAELKSVGASATGAGGGMGLLGGGAKKAEVATADATKELEKGAKSLGGIEKAAGGGLSGIMGLASGMTGLPGPAMAVGVAVGATALILDKAAETYDKVKQQTDQLTVALKDHGESYDTLQPKIEAAIKSNEAYGYNADDTRAMITKLTEAGISYADIQAGMPAIMDLARAKNISLSDATEVYTKAMMGSAKGLKDLGILLPAVSAAAADVSKAENNVTTATTNLTKANDTVTTSGQKYRDAVAALSIEQEKLAGKTHLTTAEHLTLTKAQDAVTNSSNTLTLSNAAATKAAAALQDAQDKLTLAQSGGIDKGARLALINGQLTKAVGDQRGTATEMQIAQAKLNDAWEKFAVKVGPGVQKAFAELVNIAGQVADQASILIDDVSTLWSWLEKNGVITDVGTAINLGLIKPFQILIGILQQAIGFLQTIISDAQAAGKAIGDSPIGKIAGGVGDVGGFLGGLIPKQAGGPVVTGKGYLVGEHGPEAFVPGQSGTIVPAGSLGKGGATINMTINNPVPEPVSRSAFHAGLMLAALGYIEPGG